MPKLKQKPKPAPKVWSKDPATGQKFVQLGRLTIPYSVGPRPQEIEVEGFDL